MLARLLSLDEQGKFLFPRICRKAGCFSTEISPGQFQDFVTWCSAQHRQEMWLTGTASPLLPTPPPSTFCSGSSLCRHEVEVHHPQVAQAHHSAAGLHKAGVGRGEECVCPVSCSAEIGWVRTASPEGWWTLRSSDWCSAMMR